MEIKLDVYLKLDVYDVSRDADKCEASVRRCAGIGLDFLRSLLLIP